MAMANYHVIDQAVVRAKAGDKASKALLAILFRPLVVSLSSRTPPDEQEDCAQDLWVAFYEGIAAFDPDGGPFNAYIRTRLTYTLYHRQSGSYRRFDGSRPEGHQSLSTTVGDSGGMPLEEVLAGSALDGEAVMISREITAAMRARLSDWWARLTPKQRAVIRRHDIAGEPLADIARHMGVSQAAVSLVRKRALKQFDKGNATPPQSALP